MGERRGRTSRTMYNAPMDRDNGGGDPMWGVVVGRVGESNGGKWGQL